MRFLNFACAAAISLTLTGSIFGSVVDELLTGPKKRQKVVTTAEPTSSDSMANNVDTSEFEPSKSERRKLVSSLATSRFQQPRSLSITSIPIEALIRRFSPGEISVRSSESTTPKEEEKLPQPYWLLSLDGGGIRGLMQLQIIAEIERLTKKSIIEMFDAVAGTSIGGIIAALLTMPDPENPGKPRYSAQDLLNIFSERKGEIFQSKWQSFGGLFGTRYKTTPLVNLIKDLAGDNKFSDRLLPTVLVTHNLITNEEQLFSSRANEDFYTWSIAAATGAAPTYFKPQRVFPADCHPSHRGYVLSDGGTCMNNPTMAGIALMHEVYKIDADDLNVLSLGTGTSGTGQLNSKLLRGGILRWGVSIANTCIAGQESSANKLAELYCKEHYHRLNPILDQRNIALDNITEENQDALFAAAYQCVRENHAEMVGVINSLMASANAKELKVRKSLEKFKFGSSDEKEQPAHFETIATMATPSAESLANALLDSEEIHIVVDDDDAEKIKKE